MLFLRRPRGAEMVTEDGLLRGFVCAFRARLTWRWRSSWSWGRIHFHRIGVGEEGTIDPGLCAAHTVWSSGKVQCTRCLWAATKAHFSWQVGVVGTGPEGEGLVVKV